MTDIDKLKTGTSCNNDHGISSSYKDNSLSENGTAESNPGDKNFEASTCTAPRTYCDSEPKSQRIPNSLNIKML